MLKMNAYKIKKGRYKFFNYTCICEFKVGSTAIILFSGKKKYDLDIARVLYFFHLH